MIKISSNKRRALEEEAKQDIVIDTREARYSEIGGEEEEEARGAGTTAHASEE